jgi:hypothetical protein
MLGWLMLLVVGSIPGEGELNATAQGSCTELSGDGSNTGPVIDGPDRSRDLGALSDGSCLRITERGVRSTGVGVTVDELEIDCLLPDVYERWYKFSIPASAPRGLCVSVEATFSNTASDVDVLLFVDFQIQNSDYPQGIKMFRGALNLAGIMEKIGPVLLPPGSYHLGVSNFIDSPQTDITITIAASTIGRCQALPARVESLTSDGRIVDRVFCSTFDLSELPLENNLAVANRITPPSYPATLEAVQVVVSNRQGQRDVSGQPFKLLVYTDPTGAGRGPVGAPVVNELRNLGATDVLTSFPLANPITIPQGDFYVGAFFEGAHNGRGPLFYTQIPEVRPTFISRMGITNWRGPLVLRDQAGRDAFANAYAGGILRTEGPVSAPDLVIRQLAVFPPNPARGETVRVSFTIVNQGAATAPSAAHAIVLSSNNTVEPSDLLLRLVNTPALPPNGSFPVNETVVIPGGTPAGTQFIIVIADADDAVRESNEANNTAPATITVRPN